MKKLISNEISFTIKKRALLKNISLSFTSGSLWGVFGPNGSGKTTLLKTLCGLWKASTGTVFWNGQNLLLMPRREISKTITFVGDLQTQYFDFPVIEIVKMGRYAHGKLSQEIVESAVSEMNLCHLLDRPVSQLSSGERQRVFLAQALVTEADIMLLDEPTASLDIQHQFEIWKCLQKLAEKGKLVIVACHDLAAIRRHCSHVALMQQGSCLSHGPTATVLSPQTLAQLFSYEVAEMIC